jgi:phage terminase large subunit
MDMTSAVSNEDRFANLKAQGWILLRRRFEVTHLWVNDGIVPADPEGIISIRSDLPELNTLVSELSQPTYRTNLNGKLQVEKQPDGAMSPNLADAIMICFGPLPDNVTRWEHLGR